MSTAAPARALAGEAEAYLDGLARWALARSGEPEVARVLRVLSAAALDGQLGLPLRADGLLSSSDGPQRIDMARLQRSGWLTVDADRTPAPMVLDGQRVYLWRHQRAEVRIAAWLLARAQPRTIAAQPPLPGDDPASADQRAAIAAAGRASLQVLTGGPGTGKTSTVLQLLLALLSQRQDRTPPLRIALAAPTGKAAQRLGAAVQLGKAQLGPALSPHQMRQLAHLPEHATTLHTLLSFLPGEDRFRHDASDPLPLDVLVVDEASMVDLGLMDALLDALPEQALLIVLGDPDQLVSVAAGTVLADIVASADGAGPMAAVVHRLRHVWRARGALVDLPAAIRSGDWQQVQPVLEGAAQAIVWQQAADASAVLRLQQHWLQAHADAYGALAQPGCTPQQALQALAQRQVLCAVHDGPFGMLAFNAAIAARVRLAAGVAAQTPWYRGRVVMLTHNQHNLKLYNGDVGVALEDADGTLAVWFAGGPDATGQPQPRRVLPRQLSDHEDAWAITVHKSQGSEYDQVLLVLPPDPQHRLLSRELLYTGVTRARQHLSIWATAESLQAAVQRPVQRSGGLRERLATTAALFNGVSGHLVRETLTHGLRRV